MADLAREAADDLRIMQEGRQIDLTIGDLPSCQGDRRFLKLVWINLLTNAFKYTKNRKETRIEVGWMPDDASAESVIYYVKDNGIGFNMAICAQVVRRVPTVASEERISTAPE